MFILISYFIGAFIITKFLIPMFLNMLYDSQCIRKNYKDEDIPVCMGLGFIPAILLIATSILLVSSKYDAVYPLIFLSGSIGMGMAGLLDDLLGNRSVTGLKGHFTMMLRGQLTTGGFKAAFGGIIAFSISIFLQGGWINIFINTFIIALFTNFINLLDLRPGRAIKGFLICALILIFSPVEKIFRLMLVGLTGAVIAYFPYDLKAKSMMGDIGSNILGITLGIVCTSLNIFTREIILGLLILIHIYTEKYSLTETIQKNKILNFFDEMGR